MARRNLLYFFLGGLLLIAATCVAVFYADRMFSTTDQQAVAAMNAEELAALKRLSSIDGGMSSEQVFRTLGSPSEDLFFIAKWNGFGGSILSQARIYFVDGRPAKIRWMKLGFFVYERNL